MEGGYNVQKTAKARWSGTKSQKDFKKTKKTKQKASKKKQKRNITKTNKTKEKNNKNICAYCLFIFQRIMQYGSWDHEVACTQIKNKKHFPCAM